MPAESAFLGLDIGTSGVRGCVINNQGEELATHQIKLPPAHSSGARIEQDPFTWTQASNEVILHLSKKLHPLMIAAIAIDGTSGTVLLCDETGSPLSSALMYNDQRCTEESAQIAEVAPGDCAVHGASSSLAKASYLYKQYPEANYICHQADWVASTLTGKFGISDENNCLKLGYNSLEENWPKWLNKLDIPMHLFPDVREPGSNIGNVTPEAAQKLELAEHCQVIAGTTDSIAAFLATGANETGDAVTSLGSTLVLKIISDKPVFAPESGVYSHRFGQHWLAGGASNAGGAVLKQYFDQQQLDIMTPQLKPQQNTHLEYYPLPSIGERFPRNQASLQPKLTPRPDDDLVFFQAILEGIANIEAEGYQQLTRLGAPPPKKIFTAGGGSHNQAWREIRQLKFDVPVVIANHTEASYGSALLAKQGYRENKHD